MIKLLIGLPLFMDNNIYFLQDVIKATYNNLKRLRSLIESEELSIPRPIPMFRIVEIIKEKGFVIFQYINYLIL